MTQEGYGQAYQKGYKRTVRLLQSRGASPDTAEDFAQAAWLRGWEKVDQLRDDQMVIGWVNAIAINCLRGGFQDPDRNRELADVCGQVCLDLAPIDAARILKFCGPRDRLLFEQKLGGPTTEEIAMKHGVSTATVRVRYLRARRAVRANVEGEARERRAAHRRQESSVALL